MKKYLFIIERIVLYFCILIITLASLIFLYEKKDRIFLKLSRTVNSTDYIKEDKIWFNEILNNPGYILFFRNG